MGIKFRLIVMNFLQYAIWGSWLISLGAYLGGGLDFSGLQIGSFFATMGIASRFSSPRPRRRTMPPCTAACC